MSLPLRECGLKGVMMFPSQSWSIVTPLAGVWIESVYCLYKEDVAPSLPLRECGLKVFAF